jgi:hypothetical protein
VRQFIYSSLSCWLILVVGCGKQAASTLPSGASRGATHAQVAQVNDQSTPEHTVFEFLEAIRTGNDRHAAEMLTPLARDEAAKNELVIAPPGSPTAKFNVGMVEYVTEEKDGAHVSSDWTDVDNQQQTRTDKFIWVLRKENEGWRIAGTITKVFPDQDPLVLNFEDAADMVRKLELVHQQTTGQTGESAQLPLQPEAARTVPVKSPLR